MPAPTYHVRRYKTRVHPDNPEKIQVYDDPDGTVVVMASVDRCQEILPDNKRCAAVPNEGRPRCHRHDTPARNRVNA